MFNVETIKKPENQARYQILPVYLVLDTSSSMAIKSDAHTKGIKERHNRNHGGKSVFDIAFSFLDKLSEAMIKSATVEAKVRVEVIVFDSEAEVVFPMGNRQDLFDWLSEKKDYPITPTGKNTKYGAVFEMLRMEIELATQQINVDGFIDSDYSAFRPVVFFITDGDPTGEEAEIREKAFENLTHDNFLFRPNIVCIGVGKATINSLKLYGAGKFNSPTKMYLVGNHNLVRVIDEGENISEELEQIINVLINSIVASVTFGNPTDGDAFGNQVNGFDSGKNKKRMPPESVNKKNINAAIIDITLQNDNVKGLNPYEISREKFGCLRIEIAVSNLIIGTSSRIISDLMSKAFAHAKHHNCQTIKINCDIEFTKRMGERIISCPNFFYEIVRNLIGGVNIAVYLNDEQIK